jgi:tetratricopeptide (TPR) repeat protein
VQVLLHSAGQLLPEPAGESEPFEFPLSAQEREDLRWYLEDYLVAPYAVYEERGQAIEGLLQSWGERLFDAVFGLGRPGRDAYVKARAAEPCELWIASNSPTFLGLPWELLRDPEPTRATPLALALAGLSRTMRAEAPAAESRPGSSLRVLMVIARPGGPKDVRYRMIARPLLSRLEPVAGEVDLEVLRPPTFARLKERLGEARAAGEPFQILHFDGHGVFGVERRDGGADRHRYQHPAPQGFLVFETDPGDSDPVAAETLAPVLKDATIPLLVFNACQSGKVEGGEGPDAAVATRLLLEGAAAVVAMGYTVYAVAAAEFMAAFYEALFAGKTVSQAVTEGRRQLQRADRRPSPKGLLPLDDWMVPVHYARRDVSFPELQPQPRQSGLSLADALAGLRQKAQRVEGVHEEGELAAAGGVFFGRDAEFQELEKTLRTVRVVVVHGVGGSGKTELAKGFARWLQATGGLEHPSLVFFHSFEPGVASFGLDGVVGSIGLRLFGPNFAQLGADERRHAVLQALKDHRILLIWDNFETVHSMPDPAGVTKPLDEGQRHAVKDFFAAIVRVGKGGVIVTSRSAEAWLGDEVYRVELGGLDAQDANEYAEALLAGRPKAQERRQDRAYAELLEFLGGHPLSLRLILPQLDKVKDARELLEALRGERDLPADFEGGEGRLESLAACVRYSFRHLAPEHQERLPALALFEGVADVDVLGILSRVEGVPVRFAGVGKEAWKETVEACVAAGLLTALGAGMYRIHPALPQFLVALWKERAAGVFDEELRAARTVSVRAHAALGAWLLQQIQGGSAETAIAVLDAERRTLGVAAATALDEGLFAEAQSILQSLNELWDSRGLIEEARAWVDLCRDRLEDAEDHPPDFDTPAGALWLFVVSSQANRLHRAGALDEAEAVQDQLRHALETSASASAKPRLAVVYHQLGMVAQDRGDLAAAERWYRQSLEIEEALGNRPGMASSYHQLGRVAQDRGDLAAAERWYRQSLEIEEALGNRPGIATSYHQLGMVAQDRGDLAAAERWYRQSLEIRKALDNRPDMAQSYHQLGMVAQHRGDLAAAERWYRQSLEIEETLGNRPGMASSYHQLGIVSQLRGDLAAAERWYRQSIEISEALGNRPGMALSYGQLGLLAVARGDNAGALDWTIRCIALFPEFPHPATGPGPRHLARLTAKLGWPALEESWRRCAKEPLPQHVRAGVAKLMGQLGPG